MSMVTAGFLGTGCLSLALLALSLAGGRLGHLHFGHHGHLAVPRGASLSFPALAGFVGAFGFGGAIGSELSGHRAWVATVVGLAAAVPTAWAAGRLVSAAERMSTDATPRSADLVGATGVVISPVPVGGYGEVRLRVAGQPMKFHARADRPLASGTEVFVIGVPTPTSVLVEPLR